SWNFMDDIEDLVVPEDLKNALNKDKVAFENFEAFSDSVKKQVLYWIASAKKDETRIKRIEKTLESIKKGETPF
ncbi:MAG: YdeI/OmpD-associated family protein, partial [Methanobacterium sp.]|nr:YdeI/OmpD-associated family protein [Methanobacterium sp.]